MLEWLLKKYLAEKSRERQIVINSKHISDINLSRLTALMMMSLLQMLLCIDDWLDAQQTNTAQAQCSSRLLSSIHLCHVIPRKDEGRLLEEHHSSLINSKPIKTTATRVVFSRFISSAEWLMILWFQYGVSWISGKCNFVLHVCSLSMIISCTGHVAVVQSARGKLII